MNTVQQAVCSPNNLISSSARIAKALSANVSDAVRAACGKSGSYACSHRIFSPEVNDSRSTVQECAGSEGLGDICAEIDTLTFSTREALAVSDLPTKEFERGGSMNYDEYVCRSPRGTSVQGRTLSGTIDLAYANCLDGGK